MDDQQKYKLIEKLILSRKKGPDGPIYQSDFVDLVNELVAEADKRGLNVSRWKVDKNGWTIKITWAVHHGPRPAKSMFLPEDSLKIVLVETEGTTKNCDAYKKLSQLLEQVRSLK